jgi:hypothetical protein
MAGGDPHRPGRPAPGRPQQAIALQRHRDQLMCRVLTAAGAADDSADRWRRAVEASDERITTDEYWPVVAARLNTADAAGLPVAALIEAAGREGALPDEQPAAALWWRLARHLVPVGTDLPAGRNRARPPWTGQLHAALGDTLADRIVTDRLWPLIVAGSTPPPATGTTRSGSLATPPPCSPRTPVRSAQPSSPRRCCGRSAPWPTRTGGPGLRGAALRLPFVIRPGGRGH